MTLAEQFRWKCAKHLHPLYHYSTPIALTRLNVHAAPIAATTLLGVLAFTRGRSWNFCASVILAPVYDGLRPMELKSLSANLTHM